MNKIHHTIAVSALALAGLTGCDFEIHVAGTVNPARVAEMKQIASILTPFYGEDRSQKFLNLLDVNIGAVREYSEATVAGDRSRHDAALARLASNNEDFGVF